MMLKSIIFLIVLPCFAMVGPAPEHHYLALTVKRPAVRQSSTRDTFKDRKPQHDKYFRLPEKKSK